MTKRKRETRVCTDITRHRNTSLNSRQLSSARACFLQQGTSPRSLALQPQKIERIRIRMKRPPTTLRTIEILGSPVHDIRQIRHMDPLVRRALAFQERPLSKRFLSYSSALTWYCKGRSICKCGLGLKADSLFNGPSYPGFELTCFEKSDMPAFSRLMCRDPRPSFDLHHLWYNEIVHPYSERGLTKHSDRPSALSGMAKRFHGNIPHNNYMARMATRYYIGSLVNNNNERIRWWTGGSST